ncbi:MAG TPA: hypothetical protein VMC85_19835 [Desulfomonilaceae bacterium]|nr:hypothetical protein [Desulfomonilaceae bacterium]
MMEREQALERHRKLTQEGWTRRFTAEEPRLSEMKDLYESLGLEVLVITGAPEEGRECSSCFDIREFQDKYKTIYTRGEANPEQDASAELFD